MTTLDQNEAYTLRLEFMGRRHGGWWLELIDRASGNVKILTSPSKDVLSGFTIEHAVRWMARNEWEPMYKPDAKASITRHNKESI